MSIADIGREYTETINFLRDSLVLEITSFCRRYPQIDYVTWSGSWGTFKYFYKLGIEDRRGEEKEEFDLMKEQIKNLPSPLVSEVIRSLAEKGSGRVKFNADGVMKDAPPVNRGGPEITVQVREVPDIFPERVTAQEISNHLRQVRIPSPLEASWQMDAATAQEISNRYLGVSSPPSREAGIYYRELTGRYPGEVRVVDDPPAHHTIPSDWLDAAQYVRYTPRTVQSSPEASPTITFQDRLAELNAHINQAFYLPNDVIEET